MSVLVEAISVILRVDKLEQRFPGGTSAYAAAVPNRTYCSDGLLTRVGFMHPRDVKSWVSDLVSYELSLDPQTGESDACVVVDQFNGPTVTCPWVGFSHHRDGYSYCWLAGSDPGRVATPEGWRLSTMVHLSESTVIPGAIESRASRPWDPSMPLFTVPPTGWISRRQRRTEETE